MAKEITHYICQECGYESPKWMGQCPECSKWNTLVETVGQKAKGKKGLKRQVSGAKPVKLSEVEAGRGDQRRVSTGIGEFDRVLGSSEGSAGMVPGSVMLLAGEPGIGKSTLLTQLALSVGGDPSAARRSASARRAQDDKPDLKSVSGLSSKAPRAVLYVCGEESPEQIKLRIDRLDDKKSKNKNEQILFLAETNTDAIVARILELGAKNLGLVIVDSIQTMSTEDLTGMAGSVGQIRESAFRLIEVGKRTGVPMFLVGHVTKGGTIAGPKILEHMVDVVLTLEGDKTHDFRMLRGVKNRFGPTDEVGVFAMGDSGMRGVANPSDVFLQERKKKVAGSVVVATVAGLRPMLVEIQALVVPTQLAIPRRVSTGVDQRKLTLMAAVLSRHCKLSLGSSDIFVSVASGLKLEEPAIDLGLALVIASGFLNKAIPRGTVVIGEVGLLGEIRRVGRLKQRIAEAKKMGYKRVISPEKYESLAEVVRKILR